MSALVFAFAHLKGGVGKTSLTLHIADALHLGGTKVLVIDLDPQGTARQWAAVAADSGVDGPPVIGLEGRALVRDLPKLSAGYEIVLIDCPPRLGKETRAALIAADLVVIPVVPGPESVWALGDTMEVLEEAKALKPTLRAVSVLNRDQSTGIAQATREALQSGSVPMVTQTLRQRVGYVEAIAAGKGVCSATSSSAASSEVEALIHRLLEEARGA